MTQWDFPCSDPVDINIDSWSAGSIVVSGEPTPAIIVEVVPHHRSAEVSQLMAQVQVGFEDGQLFIHGPRLKTFGRRQGLDLTIKVPAGSSCAAKTASADLSCVGELSGLTAQTASGDVTAAMVTGDVAVQSASGDVLLSRGAGDVSIRTASGDVQATRIDGEAELTTASGDVVVAYCAGSVAAHTASGNVHLGGVVAGRIQLISASGDLQVAVVPGIGVYLDLASNSGNIRSELDPGDGDEAADGDRVAAVQISCRSLSGDIRITKAQGTVAQPA